MRLHLLSPHPSDATSFYRAYGPLAHIRKHYKIEVVDDSNVTWPNISLSDAVFLQRPFNDSHLQIAQWCKDTHTKLIIDYDDLLLDLPKENKAHALYAKPQTQSNIKRILELADLCITATDYLRDQLAPLTKNAHTIPNALPKSFFLPHNQNRNRIVLWRGSDTHSHDLFTISKQLEALMLNNPDWLFCFMGYYPHYLSHIPNFRHIQGMLIHEYFKAIREAQPAIMFHSVRNHPFNHAKSMCSWLEATSVGASFCGPNTKEYLRDGIVTFDIDKPDSFSHSMQSLIDHSNQSLCEPYTTSIQTCLNEFTLEIQNKKRFTLIQEIIQK